ncbi:MAG: PspA/IM30 family protein [Gemmatimonadales bacterium]
MGFFARLGTVIRSNLNALIGRAEDPKKVLEQSLIDMKGQMTKVRQDVASAIADEKKLQAQVEREKQQADDWERRAMLAVQEGRDDLAKQALMRHAEHLQHAQQLHETWLKHKADTENLKQSLHQMNDKLEELKRKKNVLIARQRRAEAQGRIQQTMSSMNDQSAMETFNRMEEKIDDMERQAIAATELAGELSGDSLMSEFKALEYKGSADQQLIELKQKMGLLGAGASGAPQQLGAGGATKEADEAELVDDEESGRA